MPKTLALILLFAALPVSAASVYKCKTEDGVVYSNTPCAEDAEKLDIKTRTPAPQRPTNRGAQPAVNLDEIGFLSSYTPDALIEKIGPPAATFIDDGVEHWLYPNACEGGTEPVCAEILIENDQPFQITYLPRDVMDRSVTVARTFEGWRPSGEVRDKSFTLEQSDLRGLSKASVVARLGQPDVKKVHSGLEYWEYKRVPMSRSNPEKLVLYVEFKRDRVSKTMAN